MNAGVLNKYFKGVAAKKLVAGETDKTVSHQHEFNAKKPMDKLFGTEVPRKEFQAVFLYMTDDDTKRSEGKMTWYDARYRNPERTEWRLYFQTTEVSESAKEGDSLFICLRTDGTLLILIAEEGSTAESQLCWLFGLQETDTFSCRENFERDERAGRVMNAVLRQIGIEQEPETPENIVGQMFEQFGAKFPATIEFSNFARKTLPDVDPMDDPDNALMKWTEREEALFQIMERKQIENRLRKGFVKDGEVDTESFLSFSLSVQNRRKSRAGLSLENHVMEILRRYGIHFSHTPITERRQRPDFLFPGIEAYRSPEIPVEVLTMLGTKSTCKDRWRQVLSEADRIERKHLLTLEPAVSKTQTDEMRARNLQLVIPESLHSTFQESQRPWLYTVRDFLNEVGEKQAFYDGTEWMHCAKKKE